MQQPEPDHVEPFWPGGFFVAIFITNIVCVIDVYVIYAALLIVSLPQNLDQTILDLIAHQNSGVWCFSVVQLVALVYKVTKMMTMIVVMMAIMMANISLSRTTRLQGNDFDDSCDNGDDVDETLQYQK